MDIRDKLVELLAQNELEFMAYSTNKVIAAAIGDDPVDRFLSRAAFTADFLLSNGVTVQERNEEGCPYCDIAKANEGVVNTKLWVKEAETSKWTMMGKRLIFCPMCGRALPQPPKGVSEEALPVADEATERSVAVEKTEESASPKVLSGTANWR